MSAGTSTAPTLADIQAARERIAPYLAPTPARSYPGLDRMCGARIVVKHDNHLPTGAFKVRGGINLVAQMPADERARGVIAASTGNHGQSVAYAARLFGVEATICVPEAANESKVQAMKDLGATIVVHGADFDDAREHCEALARERGHRYIHSGNEPHLIAGVGTATVELIEAEDDIDLLIVPVGGGSGVAGAAIAAKGLNADIEVIGVQSTGAPAAYLSWRAGEPVADRIETFAEGLQTRTAFELPQAIMAELLDDFVLVSDDQIRDAVRRLIEHTRNLVEPAGAAPLAAVLADPDRFAGRKVALMCTGCNVTLAQLTAILAA